MDVVSLFAGIGGFDLGFDHAGFRIVAHVEKDANCRKLLASKWPNAMAFDDVCTVGKHNLPECEVVCGGSPCQGFSVAGLRKGMSDDRSNLASEFVRICDECGPTYVVWENVPGVLSMPDNSFGNFIAALVGADEPFVSPHGGKWKCAGVAVGPKRAIAWRVLDAQWFGVAQRRRRVFLVGVAHGRDGGFPSVDSAAERACQILFECEGLRRNCPPSRETGKVAPTLAASGVGAGRTGNERNEVDFCVECAPALTSSGRGVERAGETRGQDPVVAVPEKVNTLTSRMQGSSGWAPYNETEHLIPEVAWCLQERDAKGPDSDTKPGHLVPCFGIDEEQNAAENLMGCLKARKEGGGFEAAVAFHDVAGTLKDRGGNHAGNGAEEADRIVGCREVAQAITQNYGKQPDNSDTAKGPNLISLSVDQYNGALSDAQPTLGSNCGMSTGRNGVMAQMSVRRLTPTECERLQGFPDGWTAGFADSTRYKMLGNAVCRNVGEWLAFRISK